MPKMKLNILKMSCKRCGHQWSPRQEEIRICPKCKSPYWDKEKNQEIIRLEKNESFKDSFNKIKNSNILSEQMFQIGAM